MFHGIPWGLSTYLGPLHFAGDMRPAYRTREPACLLASIAVTTAFRVASSAPGLPVRHMPPLDPRTPTRLPRVPGRCGRPGPAGLRPWRAPSQSSVWLLIPPSPGICHQAWSIVGLAALAAMEHGRRHLWATYHGTSWPLLTSPAAGGLAAAVASVGRAAAVMHHTFPGRF